MLLYHKPHPGVRIWLNLFKIRADFKPQSISVDTALRLHGKINHACGTSHPCRFTLNADTVPTTFHNSDAYFKSGTCNS
jgi:hypothetical protein